MDSSHFEVVDDTYLGRSNGFSDGEAGAKIVDFGELGGCLNDYRRHFDEVGGCGKRGTIYGKRIIGGALFGVWL